MAGRKPLCLRAGKATSDATTKLSTVDSTRNSGIPQRSVLQNAATPRLLGVARAKDARDREEDKERAPPASAQTVFAYGKDGVPGPSVSTPHEEIARESDSSVVGDDGHAPEWQVVTRGRRSKRKCTVTGQKPVPPRKLAAPTLGVLESAVPPRTPAPPPLGLPEQVVGASAPPPSGSTAPASGPTVPSRAGLILPDKRSFLCLHHRFEEMQYVWPVVFAVWYPTSTVTKLATDRRNTTTYDPQIDVRNLDNYLATGQGCVILIIQCLFL